MNTTNKMKKILQYLFEHKSLTREQAMEVLVDISNGKYNEHEITSFITVYLMRSITIDELMGFRDALLSLAVKVNLGIDNAIDIVGTGGDGKDTFNISTLACFIVAGAGQPVVKHGNYGASSISGSSNVMEQLGYKFKNEDVGTYIPNSYRRARHIIVPPETPSIVQNLYGFTISTKSAAAPTLQQNGYHIVFPTASVPWLKPVNGFMKFFLEQTWKWVP